MKRLLFGIVLTLNIYTTQAQQINDYTIDAHFFPKDAQMWGYSVSNKSFMKGSANITFSELAVDTLTFYLHGELKIDSIKSKNKNLKYTSDKVLYNKDYSLIGLKTKIIAPDTIKDKTITIFYSGFMKPSRVRSLSDYMRINKEEGVFLRGYYYSPWFPVFEQVNNDNYAANFKKITVKLPKHFKAIISGQLLNESIKGEVYTAIWEPGIHKISSIQCTAREYRTISKDNISVYYISDPQSGEQIIDYTQKLKALFYSNFRKTKSASSLYIMEMPEYGNISSQNVIGISSNLYKKFNTDLHSKLTIAHELVHPYVQIPIAKENPFSALITEGFPSFFHLYGLKRITKNEDFDLNQYMKRVEKSYITKKQTGKDRKGNLLPTEKPILNISFDEIGQYKDLFILSDRVRLFLYHLWTKMGDKNYDQFLKELFQLNSINYKIFESLVSKYIPNYDDDLNIWLNTNHYPTSLQIKD